MAAPTPESFDIAMRMADRCAAVAVMSVAMASRTGRPGDLNYRAFHVAAQINGLAPNQRNLISNVTKVLPGLTNAQRERLGFMRPVRSNGLYDVVRRYLDRLTAVLDEGVVIPHSLSFGFGTLLPETYRRKSDGSANWGVPEGYLDGSGACTEPLVLVHSDWHLHATTVSGIDPTLPISGAVAVDGTEFETSARLHGPNRDVDLDGEIEYDPETTGAMRTRGARPLGIGPDDRKVYTLDFDSRSGYRTVTNGRSGGRYTGYEVHLAVQVPALRWTNYVDQVTLGPAVPGFIVNATMTPAGSHRANAIIPALLGSKAAGQELKEVIADPGYSLCSMETYHLPLRLAGISVLHKPMTHQRGIRPTVDGAVLCDDTLLHPATPRNLLASRSARSAGSAPLPYAPPGSDEATRRQYEQPFNQRALWRLRLNRTDSDGTAWFTCPFCEGALSATSLTVHSGRTPGPRAVPVSGHVAHLSRCCNGQIRLAAEELGRWQKIPAGTTAHWKAYHARRQQVENANSALKSSMTQLDKKHTLVFGLSKRRTLLGFTLAAYNYNVGAAHQAR
ncbi:hypothetical protein LY71_1168 [Geodermatophilus tzadiensis]|uniref:Transposase n=2 Tax=Geodermatophilus tzadiensis TaxID=1137988 RepID=A0A2T0TF91_9ACTN|nr:hypothetical protein LY71_1168 [Geodermatophilus tzadiensis]